jgi:hypothetical protein
MWKVIYHRSGAQKEEYTTRDRAKSALNGLLTETTQGECQYSYTDYPNMSDIITHTPDNPDGTCIGAIVYILS